MKKLFIAPLIALFFLGTCNIDLFGQEDQMIVKILKDGKSIMDTVITLDENQDPENMKAMIRHLAKSDVHVWKDDKGQKFIMKSGDKDFKFVTKQEFKKDTTGMDHEVFVWTDEDGVKVTKRKVIKGDEVIIITRKDDEKEEKEKEYTIIIKSGGADEYEFETEEIEVEVEKKKKKKEKRD